MGSGSEIAEIGVRFQLILRINWNLTPISQFPKAEIARDNRRIGKHSVISQEV